jgi:hypothetical protein
MWFVVSDVQCFQWESKAREALDFGFDEALIAICLASQRQKAIDLALMFLTRSCLICQSGAGINEFEKSIITGCCVGGSSG